MNQIEHIFGGISKHLSFEEFLDIDAYLRGISAQLLPKRVECVCHSRETTRRVARAFQSALDMPPNVTLWIDPVWWNDIVPDILEAVTFHALTLLPLKLADITHTPWKPVAASYVSGFYTGEITLEDRVLLLTNTSQNPKRLPLLRPLEPVTIKTVGPFRKYHNILDAPIEVVSGMLDQWDLEAVIRSPCPTVVATDILSDALVNVECETLEISPNVLTAINRLKADILTLVLDDDLSDLRTVADKKSLYPQVWEVRVRGSLPFELHTDACDLLMQIFGIRTSVDMAALRCYKPKKVKT